MLPYTPERTRGEGSTPLVAEGSDRHLLLYKLEFLNPSGSFKDRGTALALYYAYKMGYSEVIEDTSGNTGISVTLYARLYDLKPYIVMPSNAPLGKKALVKSLGGIIIEAIDREDASLQVLKHVGDKYYVAHTWSYFYILGATTIAYEVFEEHGVPDYIIVPIGSGGLFLGLAKGFSYMLELGIIDDLPVLVGVQGYSVQPVYRAWRGCEEAGGDSSLADGIMVVNPPRLAEIVEYLKKTRGKVVLVDNNEVIQALKKLYSKGFIVEPTSATAYAAYLKIKDELDKGTVLIPLTGSWLKMLDTVSKLLENQPTGRSPAQ